LSVIEECKVFGYYINDHFFEQFKCWLSTKVGNFEAPKSIEKPGAQNLKSGVNNGFIDELTKTE
jgi:hypothetical protein